MSIVNKVSKQMNRDEIPDNCFVMCPLWNISPVGEKMIIDNFELTKGMENGKTDIHGKKACHSYLVAKLPIKYSSYKHEDDFFEEADKLSRQLVLAVLTRLRLFTQKNVLNGDWFWSLIESESPDFIPAQTFNENDVSKFPIIFSHKDQDNYSKFLPSYKEIEEVVDHLAISKFNASFGRESLSDKLIDQIIVFESLLNDSAGDTRFKIAVRGSSLASLKLTSVNDKKVYRQNVYDWLTTAYGIRSNLVHGNKLPDENELFEVIFKLSGILTNILIKVFELKRDKKLNLFGKDKKNGSNIDFVLINNN